MRTQGIAICHQEEATSQGFASDDHIRKDCYTIYFVDKEQEDRVQELLNELDRIHRLDQRERERQWWKAHPDETECLAEGEEFVGSVWIESTTVVEGEIASHYRPASTILNILTEMLNIA
jgi:hypothetical protein